MTLSWLELLRQICKPNGLAEAHFGWPENALRHVRLNVRWLMALGLPVVFITAVLHAHDVDQKGGALERTSFIILMLIGAAFVRRVLRPDGGVMQELIAFNRGGWIDRLRYVWYGLGVVTPLLMAGLAIVGYYYTAEQLAWLLLWTVWWMLALFLVRAFLLRWLLMSRRKLALEQARERRAAALQQQSVASNAEETPAATPADEELAPDLATLSTQTKRLVNTVAVATALAGMWLLWSDVVTALNFLDRWPLWYTEIQTPTGENELQPVTIAHLAFGILIGVLTIAAARNLPGLLEMSILSRLPLDNAVRYAIRSLTSYAIMILGIVFGFRAIGIGWSEVQWLAAAITVGLGFGLQEIFANFVSGLIILFERPIRVGDIVTVDDVTGIVSRIRIRATTITNWDRKEFIVPNKEFITGRLLNWTLTDQINRVVINIGVAYGTDTERARGLLSEILKKHPIVADDPKPLVTFEGFGDSTLNMVVRCYLPNLDNRLSTVHELHTTIHEEFNKAGIEIAFPQQDLHVRSWPDSGALVTSNGQQTINGRETTAQPTPDASLERPQ